MSTSSSAWPHYVSTTGYGHDRYDDPRRSRAGPVPYDTYDSATVAAMRERDRIVHSSTLAPFVSDFEQSAVLPGGRCRRGGHVPVSSVSSTAGAGGPGTRNYGNHVTHPLNLVASRGGFIESTVSPDAQPSYAQAEYDAYLQSQLEEYYDPEDPTLDVLPRGGPSTRPIIGDRTPKWRDDSHTAVYTPSGELVRPEMMDRTRMYLAHRRGDGHSSGGSGGGGGGGGPSSRMTTRHIMTRQLQHGPAHMIPTVFDGPRRNEWLELRKLGQRCAAERGAFL